jgi:hypothetical protein
VRFQIAHDGSPFQIQASLVQNPKGMVEVARCFGSGELKPIRDPQVCDALEDALGIPDANTTG